MNEVQLIDKFLKRLTKKKSSSQGLNDDIFFDKSNKLAVSVDTYVEKVHFPNFKAPDLVIKKILRSSLSDLICKGVKPKYYFISGSGNKKVFTKKNLEMISKSLHQEQKKFSINLCGGDTTFSKKLSFSITSVGFSDKIVFRNKAKPNDDIYVTGNIRDSFLGLKIIKKKIKISSKLKNYFINQFYSPNLPYKIYKKMHKFANTSMDISDGLISDMYKLINKQKMTFEININKIPISKNLKFSDKANIYFRLKKLIDNNEMGKLFKFMLLTNNNIKFTTGFKVD